jgi:hypothetical protein
VYQAHLINCLKVLYEIYDKVELPVLIKNMLYEIEKQILIKELWDNETGYNLLVQGPNEENKVIFNRLNRRIYNRIQ